MLKSYRIQEKVKGVGFDFLTKDDSFDKVLEEIKEFNLEISKKNLDQASEEFGDILFSLIGYAQSIGINSVNALEKTNKKFIQRFGRMEKRISKQKKSISDFSLKEIDVFWNSAK